MVISPILLTPAAILFVLLAEHILLKYCYDKSSSLERLSVKLADTGKTDLLFVIIAWIPSGTIRIAIWLLTVPGIFFLAFLWLKKEIDFAGIIPMDALEYGIPTLILWYIVFDLGHYIAHILMHKIPTLWRFHKLHHSASEMNIITGTRVSLAERGFNILISFALLTLIFGLPNPELAMGLVIARQLIELVQHSDLPWDYGWVGHIVASPRFHKMHHSNNAKDFDANYANLFAFWDRLFGTIAPRYKTEGSVVADDVKLGLVDVAETRRYSRWYFALYHETFIQYLVILYQKLTERMRPGSISNEP